MSIIALHKTVEHQRAEHGALVIGHHKITGLPWKYLPELDRFAVFIDERRVERHLIAEPLIEADIAQLRRQILGSAIRRPRGRADCRGQDAKSSADLSRSGVVKFASNS